ncbi:aldo/keto reductase [Corynebacterium diphtheriae]|uniref:aldo/keto reductase n=1 Tax=Corynebacterium diphtheriae TaxID=1717 RepID=UPI0005C50D9D|nr:aldo/keto reductase [Corynebacterium diphtheriae]CAB0619846.1 aldo/keto reductase [Corynebacterium diphtheriae]
MEFTTLANGLQMPKLGYGVFQIDDDTTERTVAQALDAGYRMIDTAQAYFNERGVGAGIKDSGVAREDIFLVTKVWVTNYGRAYDSLQESLERLGTDHVDLVLLHQAYNDYYDAWRDLERAYSDGLASAIGVSNFNPNRMLDIATFSDVTPMVNQIETHVFRPAREDHAVMDDLGVAHMSWGPFAEGMNNIFANPVLNEIASAHGKTAGQVALRYLLDLDVIAISKTVRPERMAENLDVFDFSLTESDHAALASLEESGFSCFDHTNMDTVRGLLGYIKENNHVG